MTAYLVFGSICDVILQAAYWRLMWEDDDGGEADDLPPLDL